MPEIKEVLSDELNAYKSLVQKGFVEAADSFRITPEDDKPEGFPTKDREDSFTVGAYDGDQLIGVASFRREGENRRKLRHKGLLFRIYVDPNYRKQGLAGQMIQEVIDRAKRIEDIEQINLTVIPPMNMQRSCMRSLGSLAMVQRRRLSSGMVATSTKTKCS